MRRLSNAGLILAVLVSFSSVACAQCHIGGSGAEVKSKSAKVTKGEVVNNVCPVMGEKVSSNTKYRTEYKDRTVGFCCASCIKDFKANPAKYEDKLPKT